MKLERILCAEDDPDIQAVTRLALELVGGFQVRICGSGREILQNTASYAPDLILLDVMMPGMDGPTTLRHLRADPASAHIPVIFLTAKAQPAEIEHYRSLGALDAIAKPFDPMNLAARIRQAVAGAGGTLPSR
jgi:Response regulators consisting of a CheY-like receiver domain and a winged-helix DNA-binding domain